MYNYLYKCVIIGDSNVGKSCLLLRFINNNMRDNHDLTIGVEFGTKIININKNNTPNINTINLSELSNKNNINIENDLLNNEIVPIKLQIWDTAGQEYFKSITRSYYRSAAGILLVYDVSNRESFENIIGWLKEVKLYNTNNNPVIILVCNKIDLENIKVSREEGLSIARDNNLLYIETSAKTSKNINLLFEELTRYIYNNMNIENNNYENTGIRINLDNIEYEKKKCCINI